MHVHNDPLLKVSFGFSNNDPTNMSTLSRIPGMFGSPSGFFMQTD